MALGVTINSRTAPPSSGAATDGSTLFLIGKAAAGPTTSITELRSVADFAGVYGARVSGNRAAYDYLETFFREGGSHAYFARYTTDPAAALALFTADLGPGQVAAPEETPGTATYALLFGHADTFGRVALADIGNGDNTAAITTLAGQLPTSKENGAIFGPWVTVPAPSGITGIGARQVPGSAVVAGLIARADALGNPNRAAAGRDFPLQYATGFVTTVSDTDRSTLLALGVNTFANVYGVLELYGFQTAIAQSAETPFWQLNCVRMRMITTANAKALGENYMFKPLDGRGRRAAALKTDIEALLSRYYMADALYGDTPSDAYAVNVSAAVNTNTTIAQGELHAVAELRLALHAKSIVIDLVSVPVAGRVSA